VRAGHPLPDAIDQVLASLPTALIVAADGDARFVAGPAGAFVLLPTPPRGPAVDGAARRVHDLAARTRTDLGEHVAWVPFLDSLLVSTSRLVRRADVTVAPVDLLGVVLTEGPPVIDAAILAAVRRAVGGGLLGRWLRAGAAPVAAVVSGNGRIDLCETLDVSPVVSPT
jgi:hypothetical protein